MADQEHDQPMDQPIESEQPNPQATAESPDAVGPKVLEPEFAPMREKLGNTATGSINRFYDVKVPVWAEIGRVEMALGDIMKLNEGSVLRLDRGVSEPVELISQGVTLARGEVVVVDDYFAVRIKEIPKQE